MRPIVVTLVFVSATFASTTVYFARELHLERERPRANPTTAAKGGFVVPAHTALPSTGAGLVPQPEVKASAASAGTEENYFGLLETEQAHRVLRILADPEQREGMLVEYKMMVRHSSPRLAQAIGLSNEEAEQLYTLLALQQVEAQERFARCTVDPGCEESDEGVEQADPRQREIADLLGAERLRQYETYKNTRLERESVDQFQSRFPDDRRLPEKTAEALIVVLADERQKIHVEAAQRGAGVDGHGMGVGMVFSASDAATAEAQMESARANSRRLRDRAAEVLNAEQLRVFDEMQDELMITLRNQVRRKEGFSASSWVDALASGS